MGTREVMAVAREDGHSLVDIALPSLGSAADLFAATVGNGDPGPDQSSVVRGTARRRLPPWVAA